MQASSSRFLLLLLCLASPLEIWILKREHSTALSNKGNTNCKSFNASIVSSRQCQSEHKRELLLLSLEGWPGKNQDEHPGELEGERSRKHTDGHTGYWEKQSQAAGCCGGDVRMVDNIFLAEGMACQNYLQWAQSSCQKWPDQVRYVRSLYNISFNCMCW